METENRFTPASLALAVAAGVLWVPVLFLTQFLVVDACLAVHAHAYGGDLHRMGYVYGARLALPVLAVSAALSVLGVYLRVLPGARRAAPAR